MLTQAELDEMREDFALSLPDEATFYRKQYESDGQGGQVETADSPLAFGPFACRMSPLGATLSGWRMEQKLAERIAGQIGWYVTLPFPVEGFSFQMTDTLQVMLLETLELKTLEIIGTLDSRTYEVGTRLACLEIGKSDQ